MQVMKSLSRRCSRTSRTCRSSIESHSENDESIWRIRSPALLEDQVCVTFDEDRFYRNCSNNGASSGDDDNDISPIWNSRDFMKNEMINPINSRKIVSRSRSYGGENFFDLLQGLNDQSTNEKLHRTVSDGPRSSRNNMLRCESEDMKNRRRSETVINTYRNDIDECGNSLGENGLMRPNYNIDQNNSIRPNARRAAVVSTLPDSDLSVLSDTIANLQRNQPVVLSSQFKRSRWNFPKLNFMSKDKDRSREQKLEDVLLTWKPSNKPDRTLEEILQKLKNCKAESCCLHRSSTGSPVTSSVVRNSNARERKRHNAVWELFTSERTYLMDHLLVLQQIFMEPLQELQCDGYLLSVDVRSVFGNLEELCKVSMDFCHALLNVVGDNTSSEFGCADAIDSAFETFGSIMCPPYQRYFSGYRNSLTDREMLKANDDYILFIKWCEQNPRCQRLKLSDLLVAPMQHLTKFPLLLRHIAEYTEDKSQNETIERTLLAVQESLKALEGKVSWLNHFQFLQDLQSSISWPPVYEIDGKTILPESLRNALAQQPCRNLIANPKRQLVHEGLLAVVENGRTADVYALLFDDLLLITKPKKGKRKPSEVPSSLKRHAFLKDGTLLQVHRQPVALDRFMVYDVDGEQASALNLKKAFVLVQENRFQQMCSITMLQASTEDIKRTWLTRLASTAAQWMEKNVYGQASLHVPFVRRTYQPREVSGGADNRTLRKTLSGRDMGDLLGKTSNDGGSGDSLPSSTSDAKIEIYSCDDDST